jgi:hypothetical protein
MPARRVSIAGLVVAGIIVILLMVITANRPITEEELARRVQQCAPSWSNYDEDLKAQLGATPVAEWEGELEGVGWEASALTVSFALTGDWAKRDIGIPVLVKLPVGETVRSGSFSRNGSMAIYRFPTPLDSPPQWVVVRYPFYGERRVVLSKDGHWSAD